MNRWTFTEHGVTNSFHDGKGEYVKYKDHVKAMIELLDEILDDVCAPDLYRTLHNKKCQLLGLDPAKEIKGEE